MEFYKDSYTERYEAARTTNHQFRDVLAKVQEYISGKYALALISENEDEVSYKIKSYIEHYLIEHDLGVKNLSREKLIDKLYVEMVEFSILTDYLENPDVEEININSYDHIVVTYNDGKKLQLDEKFLSQRHATDIIAKLLRKSGMTIDISTPTIVGHLSNNIRITANVSPVVDSDCGTATSIRIVNPKKLRRNDFIENATLTAEMFDFLKTLQNFGTSIIVAGETGSGKTTLLGAILSEIDNDKRLITIEQDMREFDLKKRDEYGKTLNSVVNLKTRGKKEGSTYQDIDQEALLEKALTMNPDVIVVGEMKSSEAYTAQEAARTGHAVSATIHANNCRATYSRICTLCIKKYGLDYKILYDLVTEAFPVIVYCRQLPDNSRKVMEITECTVKEDGTREIRTLYKYQIENYEQDDSGKVVGLKGGFKKINEISEELQTKLYEKGLTKEKLKEFVEEVRLIGY